MHITTHCSYPTPVSEQNCSRAFPCSRDRVSTPHTMSTWTLLVYKHKDLRTASVKMTSQVVQETDQITFLSERKWPGQSTPLVVRVSDTRLRF